MKDDLELALRLLTQEFHRGGVSGDRAQAIAAIRRCLLRLPCEACARLPIGAACSFEHAAMTAGRGEAEDGPDSTGESSRRASACEDCRADLTHVITDRCFARNSRR